MQLTVAHRTEPRVPAWVGAHPWRRTATRLVLCAIVAALTVLGGNRPVELEIRRISAPLSFRLLDWELERIAERAPRIAAGLVGRHQEVDPGDRRAVAAYFEASGEAKSSLRPAAEAAIERALAGLVADQGLTIDISPFGRDNLVFPPVSFTFVSPPQLLVVSPRDRIEVQYSELLRAGVTQTQAVSLESRVDQEGVSSLVVPIAGLASYPAMVLDDSRPVEALSGVAHEWIHGYLFFHPLGRAYWSTPSARSINETATDMAARELARQLAVELDLAPAARPAASPAGTASRRPESPARAILRDTRIEVERLLAAGQIEAAESLMRQRRDELAAAGHDVRKLNQAYFAFYGSYGDAAAGRSPIPGRLQRLRESSDSVGEFLRRVAQLRDGQDLARAVGDA